MWCNAKEADEDDIDDWINKSKVVRNINDYDVVDGNFMFSLMA